MRRRQHFSLLPFKTGFFSIFLCALIFFSSKKIFFWRSFSRKNRTSLFIFGFFTFWLLFIFSYYSFFFQNSFLIAIHLNFNILLGSLFITDSFYEAILFKSQSYFIDDKKNHNNVIRARESHTCLIFVDWWTERRI